MTLYFLAIKDYKNNANKINNLDNENIYKTQHLEIKGNFWGLRKYKKVKKVKKFISNYNGIFGSNIIPKPKIDTEYRNRFNEIQIDDYLLLGDQTSGYFIFKIKGKFENETSLFDEDIFNYCFLLQKTGKWISRKELEEYTKENRAERNVKLIKGRRLRNISKNFKINTDDFFQYIRDQAINRIMEE